MEESGPEISTFLGIKNVKVTTIKMRNQFNQMIELLYYQEQPHKNDIFINQLGPTHLALSVSNLDDLYQNFKKQNIEFISSPIITDNDDVRLLKYSNLLQIWPNNSLLLTIISSRQISYFFIWKSLNYQTSLSELILYSVITGL